MHRTGWRQWHFQKETEMVIILGHLVKCFGVLNVAEFQTVLARTLRRSVRAYILYTTSTFARSRS